MAKQPIDRYTIDPHDGLRVEVVGSWSLEKHSRLRKYVDITKKRERSMTTVALHILTFTVAQEKFRLRGRNQFRTAALF